MKRILTTLTAATVLALGLTAEAHAGHHMQHQDQQHNNPISTGNNLNLIVHHDKSASQLHVKHQDRLLRSDCRDFRYCCWRPSCDTYLFWYPADDCWYYWCASRGCYLPYDQIADYPPEANVIPRIPGGLPPVVPGGDDNGPTNGKDAPAVMPPADGPDH